jgi:hypothetical protein
MVDGIERRPHQPSFRLPTRSKWFHLRDIGIELASYGIRIPRQRLVPPLPKPSLPEGNQQVALKVILRISPTNRCRGVAWDWTEGRSGTGVADFESARRATPEAKIEGAIVQGSREGVEVIVRWYDEQFRPLDVRSGSVEVGD